MFSRMLFRVEDYLQLLYLSKLPVLDGNLDADGAAVATTSGLDSHFLEYHHGTLDPALVVRCPINHASVRFSAHF